ncbi:MAG: glycosyltransferase family 2 protein, partial [Bacteroidia bacterium]|nr:glycosyltransferase family 2 protein [Bacteroidia bacterium]
AAATARATEMAAVADITTNKMKTAVVILNWNTKGYLERFLPGLISSVHGHNAEVIVADSASNDGSMEMMAAEFPQVRRIVLDSNYGFTGGYNRALAQVDAEYFVLINSDIEVQDGWLEPLVDWMDSHPECGACGPKLKSWYDRDSFEYAGAAGGKIDRWGYTFCRGRILKKVEKDHGQYDSPADVFWVSGACLLTRSSLWKKMGGLDDRFFAHMEEIDYCWRLQLAGHRISVVPGSVVYHLGGGTLPGTSPWKLKLNFRNNLLMLDNNLARTLLTDGENPRKAFMHARRTIFFRMLLDGASAAVYLLTGKKDYFKAVLEAHREFKALRNGPDVKELEQWNVTRPEASVKGRFKGSILLGQNDNGL